jgi:hypothetical protein
VRASYGAAFAFAELLLDASSGQIFINNSGSSASTTVIQTGTGAANDGTIRVTKSGSTLTLANFTGSVANISITVLSAVARKWGGYAPHYNYF